MAMRRAPGVIACRFSTSLPNTSSCWLLTPVMLPPGLDRLTTKPLPTGFDTLPMTMGIVFVARCAARVDGRARSQNNLDLLSHQILVQRVQAIHIDRSHTSFDIRSFPFHPTEILHCLPERRELRSDRRFRREPQYPDTRERRDGLRLYRGARNSEGSNANAGDRADECAPVYCH